MDCRVKPGNDGEGGDHHQSASRDDSRVRDPEALRRKMRNHVIDCDRIAVPIDRDALSEARIGASISALADHLETSLDLERLYAAAG